MAATNTTADTPSIGADYTVSARQYDLSTLPLNTTGTVEAAKYGVNAEVIFGCAKSKRVRFPSQVIKAIPCKLVPAQWTAPGRGEVGNVEITFLDFHTVAGDIFSFDGARCTIFLKSTFSGDGLLARTLELVDCMPAIELNVPDDGDTEAEVSVSTNYQRVVITFT